MSECHNRVENTNSESLISKLSVAEKGYRCDPFLKYFVNANNSKKPLKCRRSPAINRGYFTRLISLENSFEKIITLLNAGNEEFQVLSLGAGYDTMYFRLRNVGLLDSNLCRYFEVDFPIAAKTKANKIFCHTLLRSFFTRCDCHDSISSFSFDNGIFSLIGCDMTNTDHLQERLDKLGFACDKLTVVLTECSTTYLEVSLCHRLFQWISRKYTKFILVDYEQILPFDTFGQIMVNHFSMRGSPLKCIDHHPTAEDQLQRFRGLGWTPNAVLTIDQVVQRYVGLAERVHLRSLLTEPFDEFEELQLKCSHYILAIAMKSVAIPTIIESFNTNRDDVRVAGGVVKMQQHEIGHEEIFARFGHRIIAISSDVILIFGGYSRLSHRDSALIVLQKKVSQGWEFLSKAIVPYSKTMFSGVAATSDRIYIFGGRSSPNDASREMMSIESRNLSSMKTLDVKGQIPSQRWKHTLSAISDQELVLIGGKDISHVFADIFIFKTATNEWKFLHRLPHGLHSHSAVPDPKSRRIFISGGLDAVGQIVTNIYIYNVGKSRNADAITLLKVTNLIPRFSHTSHLLDSSRMVLIGGVSSSQEPGIAIVDLQTGIASEYLLMRQKLDAPLACHASHFEEDEQTITIFGGGTNCFSFGMHLNKYLMTCRIPT